MYITVNDIKNEISLEYPIDNRNRDKKIGLIRAYFIYSFYNVEKDEKIHLKNFSSLLVKRGCYTMKDIEKVSSGKVKYDSLTDKSVIDPTISRFDPYKNKILGISNRNYIDMLLSKKMFSFKINKLSTTDNILNGKPCDVLYIDYLNKDISFGDIIYFEPKNVQYKKLVNGTINQLIVSLVDGDGNEIFSDFKISIVLHIVMEVGDKLNRQRSYRKGFALKGLRKHIIKTNNPSTIGPGELLTVRFPDLKENQVIIPETTKLTFNITLAGTDVNRTLVENLGRNIIRKLVVKLEGNEIVSIDDCNILYSYYDCWKTATERRNAIFQGIVEVNSQTENAIKHRINAGDKANNAKDQTVASIYDNRFCIPLDFEILETSLPLYQYGLGSRLTYEITFADYSNVIKSTES